MSAQPTKVVKPLKLHSLKGVSAKEFQEAQRKDPTLRKLREYAAEGKVFTLNERKYKYLEVPQASTRFSPFELLYGRTVKGPLHVLKKLWEEEDCTPETKATYEYVIDLRNRLEETCKLAREELAKAKEYQKSRYDQKARERKFKVGDKVLLLFPTSRNKNIESLRLLQSKGPFTITECSHSLTYVVCVKGVNKKYHVNMLKRYEERDDASSSSEESEDSASPCSPY
ncbi:uncharacterized protein [Procambarus clarkii]|uniref:uncharacterized protein n=1 Tax=Procambarus clarkii TaxID=6728 RepID=UPI00374483A8